MSSTDHFFFIVADISVKENHDSVLWQESNNRQQFYKWSVFLSGRYFWEFLVGVCRPVLQILTLFQRKKCHFSHPFSDLASKKLCPPLLLTAVDQNTNKKLFLKIHFELVYFSFFLTHFGIEVINTFIHSCSFPENHTRFQTKTAQNHTLWGVPLPRIFFHSQLSYTQEQIFDTF